MTDKSEIPERLRNIADLLRYEPETGKLFWRHRDTSYFSVGRDRNVVARVWNKRHAGKEAFTADDGSGYRIGLLLGKKYRAHRLIWLLANGEWPDTIDHLNGNRSDNRLANLRNCTIATNATNTARRSDNRSGVKGVSCTASNTWVSYIHRNRRQTYLGTFRSKADAVAARKHAEKEFGFHVRS